MKNLFLLGCLLLLCSSVLYRGTRKLFLLIFMCLCVNICVAQSANDKIFSQAVELSRVKSIKSLNEAIAKFKTARIAFDSSAKKLLCDVEIKKCIKRIEVIKQNQRQPKQKVQSPKKMAIDYGPILWVGDVLNGLPHGHGFMYFRKTIVIDPRDPDEHEAGDGDYIEGDYVNGFLEKGRLKTSRGTESIVIGR